jgi:hypothetical protein
MLERPSGPFITGMIAAMRLCAGHSSLSVIPSGARNLAAGHEHTDNREVSRRLRDSGCRAFSGC